MNWLLLINVPIVISIIWAAIRTTKRSYLEAALLAFVGFVIVTNGVLRHFVIEGYGISDSVTLFQQILSSLIIPCTYVYFSRQAGRPTINETSVFLVSLVLFLFFPNIVIVADNVTDIGEVGYKAFLIVGKERHPYMIADFIVTLQAVITCIRIVPLYNKIKKYGLSLSKDVKIFLSWWCVTAAFITFSSYHSEMDEYNLIIDIVCHITFMLLVTWAFYKLGDGFDLRPVITEEKESVELDAFVCQSKELARRFEELVDGGAICKQGYSAEDAILALGTNRTYFFRMVKAEFGKKFSEIVNEERIKRAKNLLVSTDMSLAEVSDRCGFASQSYMSKVFRKLVGKTPSEYRDEKS